MSFRLVCALRHAHVRPARHNLPRMPRLVPNPIGELMNPLQRIEAAITGLADRLHPGDSGPSVQEELGQVNQRLDPTLLVPEETREELAGAAPKRPAA